MQKHPTQYVNSFSGIHGLRERTGRDDLLDGIRRMKTELREYEQAHDAVSPEELARRLSGADDGWEDVTAWKTTRQNLAVAQAALVYDEASDHLAA